VHRIESLEQQLVWREEKVQNSLQAQRELQDRVTAYHQDFEREKEDIFDISADMTRQYKGMQEELIAQINKLEQTIAERDDQVEKLQVALEEVRRQMTVELALKDNEIEGQKQKMEDMAMEFGDVTWDLRRCTMRRRHDRSRTHTTDAAHVFFLPISACVCYRCSRRLSTR
jgi:predicted RNase H-like nuclease (RuvC/YqgF family)